MWSLNGWRNIFMAVGLIGVIGFSLPSASVFLRWPGGEKFSELYFLGSGHMADEYPFNVNASADSCLVYLGIGDYLGSAAYYEVRLKFGTSSEALPNATSGISSQLSSLFSYEVFLADRQKWEGALNFSFAAHGFGQNVSSIRINDTWVTVDKSAAWDTANNGYFYHLTAELWLFDTNSEEFAYHNRFVTLWLNLTSVL